MERYFHKELNELKQELLKMALLTKEAIEDATHALLDQDLQLADNVIAKDKVINTLEIEIDDKAHSLLTLRQPMAVDMRLLTMILKINNDLERIGDHAVNIAERVRPIREQGAVTDSCPVSSFCPVAEMSKLVTAVLIDAVEAFLKADAGMAQKLLQKDDDIDDLNDRSYAELSTRMLREPEKAPTCLALIMISHNLERVGDLANNIAEDVIYIAQGREVRHHSTEETKSAT